MAVRGGTVAVRGGVGTLAVRGRGGRVGWSVGLDWRPDCPGRVRIPLRRTSLRNFGNSVYPALSVSFGGDTSALECVTVVDSATLREGQL